MQVAAVLSDLKSLSACSPEAALNLVSVHKQNHSSTQADAPTSEYTGTDGSSVTETNPDLARAATLITLHQSVKVRYEQSGLDEDLLQARVDVNRILGTLSSNRLH